MRKVKLEENRKSPAVTAACRSRFLLGRNFSGRVFFRREPSEKMI